MASLNGINFNLPRAIAARPLVVSAGVTASYIVFYTAYDKSKGSLHLPLLIDFAMVRRGWNWTLVEANKALSLSGITLMLLSLFPLHPDAMGGDTAAVEGRMQLQWISMNMLWLHSLYSAYKFYGLDPRRVLSDKAMKRLSIALGSAGQLALSALYLRNGDNNSAAKALQFCSSTALAAATALLAVGHFWTMEVDYKYVLQVRPFAYLPFPLSALALYQLWTGRKK